MDFIKGNEQVKIDPSGIDISGVGNIIIDSNSVTGDISFNSKVSVSDDFDVNGDIKISGNDNFVITNDGKVGIGTTTPNTKLEVNNGVIRASGETARIQIARETGQNILDFWHGQDFILRSYDGTNEFNRMTIDRTGNVGIGLTTPEAPLDVQGNNGVGLRVTHDGTYRTDYRNDGININPGNTQASTFAFEINNIEKMRLHSNGYIGIGTTNPLVPLEVRGRGQRFDQFGSEGNGTGRLDNNHFSRWIYFTGNGNADGGAVWVDSNGYVTGSSPPETDSTVGSNGDFGISIRCEGSMWLDAPIFFTSDARIKTDISNIDDDKALQQVNRLESKEYHYIDPEHRRLMKTIGFIAQEVKKVIPNAVSIQKNWVPDEMRIITDPQWTEDAGKYYLNIPDLDMSGAFTNKAKFYVSNDPSGNDEVCKEVDIKEVPTTSMNEFSTTNYVGEFDQSWNNVFFYGKQVTDFHTIDKAQIFALHHSAIQELDRKHEREVTEKNNKIQNIEGEVSNLTGQVSSLTSRLEALEASVLSLQNN